MEVTPILSSISKKALLKAKFATLMEMAEYDFNVSVELINGLNSYWTPTPLEEVEELECRGIVDIGDDQSEFEKLISLVHEIGHVIFSDKKQVERSSKDSFV